MTAGTLYYFRVQATAIEDSGFSNVIGLIAGSPAVVGDLTAAIVSATQIDLTWVDSSDNELGFRIERSTDGINFTEVATQDVDVEAYSAIGLNIDVL